MPENLPPSHLPSTLEKSAADRPALHPRALYRWTSWRTGVLLVLLTAGATALAWIARGGETLPEAPADFQQMLSDDPPAMGKVWRPSRFILAQRGAVWDTDGGGRMEFVPLNRTQGYYRLDARRVSHQAILRSVGTIPLTLNRSYLVSAVIRCNFPRGDAEINLRLAPVDGAGHTRAGVRELGVPSKTNGWQRYTWEVTPRPDGIGTRARCEIRVFADRKHVTFEIADFSVTELPPKPLPQYAPGTGVTFRGGPGNLPMRVESVQPFAGGITVTTTGARYTFQESDGVITAEQRIDAQRPVARWQSSLRLDGLRIDRWNERECVLGNSAVTFGIQADGVLVVAPHAEAALTLENLIGGPWNRFEMGSLISTDDFGGFTVNPDVPLGTGRPVRVAALTDGLDFVNWTVDDTSSLSRAPAGWQMRWQLSPGERLFTSVMPHRPFDWESSFRDFWHLAYAEQSPDAYLLTKPHITDWVLWDFTPRRWGMSYPELPVPANAARLSEHIRAIHAAGRRALPYLSAFFDGRRNVDAYIQKARTWREVYGVDGVYIDGLPGPEWVTAYEQMRMLRELFPGGSIIVHDTFDQSGRVAPYSFIHTYADRTFLAEGIRSNDGPGWPYPRYVVSQFRKANCIGDIKGDGWRDIGDTPAADLINIVYNGRPHAQRDWFVPTVLPVLAKLKELWRAHGGDPFFYDRYYLPAAQELTGYRVGCAGMPIAGTTATGGLTLHTRTPGAAIHYTTDGTTPTALSPRYNPPAELDPAGGLRAVAFAAGLSPSRELVLPAP